MPPISRIPASRFLQRRPLRPAVIAVALALSALAWPGGAAAASPTWVAPAPAFEDASSPVEVATAMNPDGSAWIARTRLVGTGSSAFTVIDARLRSKTGELSAPTEVYQTTPGHVIVFLRAFGSPDGSVALTFASSSNGAINPSSRWLARVDPDGHLAYTFQIGSVFGGLIDTPKWDAHGNAYLTGPGPGEYDMLRSDGSGVTPFTLPAPPLPDGVRFDHDSQSPDLAVSPDGKLLFLTTSDYWTGCNEVSELWLTEGTAGEMGAPQNLGSVTATGTGDPASGNCTLTGGFLLEDPVAITVDAQGAVTLAFQATQAGVANPQTELVAIHRSADGTWGDSEGIATLPAGSVELTMAGSTPTLIWSDTGANGLDTGSYLAMAWAARQADGTWKAAAVNADLSGSEMAYAPLADGSTLFTWTSGSGALQLNAARFLPDGTQDIPKVLLTSAAVSPHPAAVAADAAGNAIVVTADASGQTQFTGLDGSGPVVDHASVPAAGVAGVADPFTVTAHDLWSPVTSTWDFGDGTSATGATVEHAFGAAGHYTATATLTDAAGHTTTTSGQVAVTDPPSPASTSTKTVTPPPLDRTAPRFTAKPAIHGTALTFGLSEAGKVVVTITRHEKGVREGRRCVAPRRHEMKARRCTRMIAVSTLHETITGRSGKLVLPAKVRRTAGT